MTNNCVIPEMLTEVTPLWYHFLSLRATSSYIPTSRLRWPYWDLPPKGPLHPLTTVCALTSWFTWVRPLAPPVTLVRVYHWPNLSCLLGEISEPTRVKSKALLPGLMVGECQYIRETCQRYQMMQMGQMLPTNRPWSTHTNTHTDGKCTTQKTPSALGWFVQQLCCKWWRHSPERKELLTNLQKVEKD